MGEENNKGGKVQRRQPCLRFAHYPKISIPILLRYVAIMILLSVLALKAKFLPSSLG